MIVEECTIIAINTFSVFLHRVLLGTILLKILDAYRYLFEITNG